LWITNVSNLCKFADGNHWQPKLFASENLSCFRLMTLFEVQLINKCQTLWNFSLKNGISACYLKTLVITSAPVKVKRSSSLGKQGVDKALPKFTISFTQFFFSSNRRGKIAYSNNCSLTCESHIPECFFWSWISTFFSVRLCRSKRLNFKNLSKILVLIEFKFDKANMTREYSTYTTWLWYWYSCLHNSRRAVDLSDTFKSFLLAPEPSEW